MRSMNVLYRGSVDDWWVEGAGLMAFLVFIGVAQWSTISGPSKGGGRVPYAGISGRPGRQAGWHGIRK